MPINWQDGSSGGTPLSAANLNRLAVVADIGATGTPTGDAVKAAAAAQVNDAAVAAATSGPATSAALRAAYLPKWKANTAYALGEPVVNPSGQTVTANAAFTSGSSYDGSKWTLVAGLVAGTVAGQLLVWDGAAYSPQTPADVTPDDIGALSQASAFAPQPVTVGGWCTVAQDTSAYSFPARVLPPQTNRKRFVIRNRGTSPVWIGYGTGDESNYNRPADANFTANGVVAVGQEWVEGPSEQAVFVRPTTNGPAVLVSVYVELGA